MERLKFILKVVGIAVVLTGFVVSWGIIVSNQYGVSNAPTIILSSINVIVLVSLAFFTYRYMKSTTLMANEMRATRELEFELNNCPKVLMRFDPTSNGMLYIVVENTGNGAAKNIKIKIEPELRNSSGKPLDEWPALKNGINYLPPKEKLRFFLDTVWALAGDPKLPKDYTVKLEYDWAIEGRPKIYEVCPLETSPYVGTDLASYKDFSTLIDEVEKIRKALEKRK